MSRRGPFGALIDSLEGNNYTISEASLMTGIPVSTLRSWYRNNKTTAPSNFVAIGESRVYLYSDEDIAELRAIRPATPTVQRRQQ